jgi:hypothetical protein
MHFRAVGLVSASVLLSAGLAVAGCSSSSSSPPAPKKTTPAATPSPTPSPSTSSSSGGGTPSSATTKAIETNWAKFFNAKTPISQRLALLQNGSQFSSVIQSQAGSSLALAATSKVTHVSLTGTSQAAVTYDILISGTPALSDQAGVAVLQGGVWKVGDASFCGLLKLEGSTLPAGCPG